MCVFLSSIKRKTYLTIFTHTDWKTITRHVVRFAFGACLVQHDLIHQVSHQSLSSPSLLISDLLSFKLNSPNKLLHVKSNHVMEVETIVIDSVPRFNELFPLYEMEHQYLENNYVDPIWNKEILNAKNYKDFTQWHLKEVMRLRFLPTTTTTLSSSVKFPSCLRKSVKKGFRPPNKR